MRGSSGAGISPEPDRNYGNLRIAYHAARQLHPSANEWFRDVRQCRADARGAGVARPRGVARRRVD